MKFTFDANLVGAIALKREDMVNFLGKSKHRIRLLYNDTDVDYWSHEMKKISSCNLVDTADINHTKLVISAVYFHHSRGAT